MATVLIVDDSASLRTVVKMTLVNAGHIVLEAENGQKALELLDGRPVNMIISDVNMPVMGGLEFCAKAKSLQAYKYTPVLMLTTEASDEKKDIGKKAGAAGWMVKPFSPTQLLSAVNKLAK